VSDVTRLARILGVEEVRVRSALASAIRRSKPDAREVYGVIEGRRFVARRVGHYADWKLSLERRQQPWEREATALRRATFRHTCAQECERVLPSGWK
jgi:hypothetical protein